MSVNVSENMELFLVLHERLDPRRDCFHNAKICFLAYSSPYWCKSIIIGVSHMLCIH